MYLLANCVFDSWLGNEFHNKFKPKTTDVNLQTSYLKVQKGQSKEESQFNHLTFLICNSKEITIWSFYTLLIALFRRLRKQSGNKQAFNSEFWCLAKRKLQYEI